MWRFRIKFHILSVLIPMKRFHIKVLLCIIPVLIAVLAIFLVDPYYLFTSETKFNIEKYDIGYSYDQGRRYKIFTYWNNPTDKIILGASEINIINERNIPQNGWHSLSYGGAPLQESLKMYWEVSKENNLSVVLLAPEFIKYYNAVSSAYGNANYESFSWETSQSFEALDIYYKKWRYFTDRNTIRSTWFYLCSQLGIKMKSRSKPSVSKEAFWEHQLSYAHEVYEEYEVYSNKKENIRSLLFDIKKDADAHNTNIMIVIPVQHVDLLKIEFQDSVYSTYIEYIQVLTEIFGQIHYLAYSNGISEDDGMFSDPFHCVNEDFYINKLFKGGNHLILDKENYRDALEDIKTYINNYE